MAIKRIITHNGCFHCDDVFACCLIKFLPIYKDAEITRTRDDETIKKGDIVIDVGGEYNPDKLRFDHHQQSFNLTLKDLNPKLDHTIRLSSAGLIFHHFGKEILIEVLKSLGSEQNDEQKLNIFYEQIYRNFVKEIDAIDNGIMICDSPKYEIHTSISSRISEFNLKWNEEQTEEKVFERFLKAIDYIREEFLSLVKKLNNLWWPCREIVKNSIQNRFNIDETGEIIEITGKIVPPFLKHLFMVEKDLNIVGQIKYCIFQDNDVYRVRSIPIDCNSFILRKPLPEKWRGLRSEELINISQIPDVIFVHSTGFIGGTKTRESAFKMAKFSLINQNSDDNLENGIKKQKLS